ncbi:peroxidasin homolog [Mauremys mutica]|uniref:peroxidasin homolog n=1 Tax=Mauremys mutica TaxID=74926 RepID=UPI001D16EF70|nr:peroxidasin homolog [Mauremys mutica]
MLPRPVSPQDPDPAPQLTLSPQQPVYITGEDVTLTCSATGAPTMSGIRFFRENYKINSTDLLYTNSIQLSGVSRSQAGAYTCEFWKTESGQEITSKRSPPISIAVTAPLPAPKLTVFPQPPVYITGEAVTLTCSATGAPSVSGVRFFRDHQKIQSEELPSPRYSYTESIRLSGVSGLRTGVYSCESWKTVSGREIPSKKSPPISITVTAPLPAPKLTVFPQQPVYITGEAVTLTCSATWAPTVSGVWFFRDGQKIQSKELSSPRYSYTESIRLSGVSGLQTGVYSCESWKTVSGREIPSERSQPISIAVTDLPPQPALSVDPPSGAVREGIHLLMTCTAPRNAGQRRFHFYKDRVELIPGDVESEINTTEPRTVSVNTSVISIPRASSNNTGEFTCGYEEHVGGRWIPSPRSRPMTVTGNVTVSAQSFFWVRELVVGGSFFLINGLISLVSHCCL